MKLAFATGINGEFAYQNGLPWGKPIKEDMHHFVNFTRGTKLIMGYRTWKSLPPKTAEKYHDAIIIFSRVDDNYFNHAGILCRSTGEFVESMNHYGKHERTTNEVEYCIIGGAQYVQNSIVEQVPVSEVLHTVITPKNDATLPCDFSLSCEALSMLTDKFEHTEAVSYETVDFHIVVNYYKRELERTSEGL